MTDWLAAAELYAAAGHKYVPIPIEEIRAMASKSIGRVDKAALAKGKIITRDSTPGPLRAGKHAKADRAAKAWLKKSKQR